VVIYCSGNQLTTVVPSFSRRFLRENDDDDISLLLVKI